MNSRRPITELSGLAVALAATIAVLSLPACVNPPPATRLTAAETPAEIANEPAAAKDVRHLSGRERPRELGFIIPSTFVNNALGRDRPYRVTMGILVDESGGVEDAWIIESAFPADASILNDARAQRYAPLVAKGKPVKWKTATTVTMTPSPMSLEEILVLHARLGAMPSATDLTDEYATSVDRPADERAKILTAAVASWERLAKEYPSKIEVARGMTRQLAAVAALLGDPAPTVSPGPGAAAQGEEPPHWNAKMILLPRYPNAAIPRRLIGSVSVDVDLDDSGVVRAATIRSSDDALFNQAALAAAMLTRLDPPHSASEARFTIVERFPPVMTGKLVR